MGAALINAERQMDGYDKGNRPSSLLHERAGKVWNVTAWYVRNGIVFSNPQVLFF